MAGMMLVGKLANKVDLRHLIVVGLLLMILSLWQMTCFSVEVSRWEIIYSGVIQGFGMGLVFVPLSTISFSTLAPQYRNEGTALYSLIRNIGSSIGISAVTTYLSQRVQINHAAFADYITPFNKALQEAVHAGAVNITTTSGLVKLNSDVTFQASVLGYLQDFRIMMLLCVLMLLMMVLLKKPKKRAPIIIERKS